MSPTQRTLRELRNRGRVAAIVERWNQYAGPAGQRQDLFGFIDVIALCPTEGIVGVQCCAGSGFAAHFTKITVERCEEATAWLQAGGKIELWGWRKVKLYRGGKAERWQPRIEAITIEEIEPAC